MSPLRLTVPLLAACTLLSGCASLTGFSNAQTDFSCSKFAGQPSCRTISDIYAENNTEQGEAVTQSKPESEGFWTKLTGFELKNSKAEDTVIDQKNYAKNPSFAIVSPATPWRKPETIFRIWMPAFTDDKGDLHDQRYMYVKVLEAGWDTHTVEELSKSDSPYRPVYPLSKNDDSAKETKKPNPLNTLRAPKSS